MNTRLRIGFLAASLAFPAAASTLPKAHAGGVPVRLVGADGRVGLVREGRPYVVKGAGGDGSLEALKRLGGNSTRTWGVDGLDRRLDEARRLGLTVAVGIWLGQPRQGFRYDDPASVARQAEEVRRVVLKYKDHPAVLAWGLGNEIEGDGNDPAVWSALERLAVMVKSLDPDHPTYTAIAEIGPGGSKVKALHRFCPTLDIVGVNSYGGAASIPERYRAAGGSKPFLLTEYGPLGPWESPRDARGIALEPTSTAKAELYRGGQASGTRGLGLGSYAFLWGWKQEATATWFGMFLPDGSRLAAAEALGEIWTGRPPENRCPTIGALTLDGPEVVAPGATVHVRLDARDAETDAMEVRFLLRNEVARPSTGGDREAPADEFPRAVVSSSHAGATIRLPAAPGGYRVFAEVRDGKGGAAVANVPVRVEAPATPR